MDFPDSVARCRKKQPKLARYYAIMVKAGKQCIEILARLDDAAFRRGFHAWSFRGIKNFFHTRHIDTLVQLVPPSAWTDQQLIHVAKLLHAQRMDFSGSALGQLQPRLMNCEAKTLVRMMRYSDRMSSSDAIARLVEDTRRSVT